MKASDPLSFHRVYTLWSVFLLNLIGGLGQPSFVFPGHFSHKSQKTQSSASNAPMTSDVKELLCWTQTMKHKLVGCLPMHLTNRISASPSVYGGLRPTLTSPSPTEKIGKTSLRLKLNHLSRGTAELLYQNVTSKRGSSKITEAITSPAGHKCQ